MGLRETWSELGTGGKVLVGLGVCFGLFVVVVPILLILAAVLGSFVLGMGAEVPQTPQASFSYEYQGTGADLTATIAHDGGETVDGDELEILTESGTVDWPESDGEVEPGDSITIDVDPGDDVSVIWTGGEKRRTLAIDEAPDR